MIVLEKSKEFVGRSQFFDLMVIINGFQNPTGGQTRLVPTVAGTAQVYGFICLIFCIAINALEMKFLGHGFNLWL